MLAAGTLSVFTGAFLLFQVQPIMARFILPAFGGSPDVWTTCMLFFQLLLLAGYAWAHLVATRLPPRGQAAVHVLVLIAAVVALPIIPAANAANAAAGPVLHILLMLARSVGLPFFILAATSPLIQAWFSRTVAASPYRLYALSNAGSLLALLSYPFLVEPLLTRRAQAALWGSALIAFAIVSAAAAILFALTTRPRTAAESPHLHGQDARATYFNWRVRLLWLLLPAGACVVLLAVTNKISQDITVVPLFWVLPLAVYLLSFVLCFDHARWYVRNLWGTVFVLAFVGLVAATALTAQVPAGLYIAVHTLALFACCMVFHGELYRLRPHASHLTAYYLTIATGGALGGLFVVVIAPLVFSTYFELYVGLLGCCLFILLTQPNVAMPARRGNVARASCPCGVSAAGASGPCEGSPNRQNDHGQDGRATSRRRLVWTCLILAAGVAGFTLQQSPRGLQGRALARSRNFFGVLTVWEKHDPERGRTFRVMQHGATNHGLQFTSGPDRGRPAAYFGPQSGVGLAIASLPDTPNRRIGVIGLGVGAIAAYGRAGDRVTFYEINPDVERHARTYFTYLEESPADVDVIVGDARLSLQHEGPRQFDLLVLDAFTGDAVPVHLLTTEAFQIYLDRLKPGAPLALHISSNHVDLPRVVRRLAQHVNLHAAWIETHRDEALGIFDSDWIILTPDPSFLNTPAIIKAATPFDPLPRNSPLWTDDHTNLLPVLK
jgi:uncharacterized integral membrane protein